MQNCVRREPETWVPERPQALGTPWWTQRVLSSLARDKEGDRQGEAGEATWVCGWGGGT